MNDCLAPEDSSESFKNISTMAEAAGVVTDNEKLRNLKA